MDMHICTKIYPIISAKIRYLIMSRNLMQNIMQLTLASSMQTAIYVMKIIKHSIKQF